MKKFLIAFLLALISLPAFAVCPNNVVSDPGFELNSPQWTIEQFRVERVQDPVHSGSWSTQLVDVGRPENLYGILSQELTVSTSAVYQVSFWGLGGIIPESVTMLEVTIVDGDETVFIGSWRPGNRWTALQGYLFIPKHNTVTLKFTAKPNGDVGDFFWVDDICVKPIAYLPPNK